VAEAQLQILGPNSPEVVSLLVRGSLYNDNVRAQVSKTARDALVAPSLDPHVRAAVIKMQDPSAVFTTAVPQSTAATTWEVPYVVYVYDAAATNSRKPGPASRPPQPRRRTRR
jgi:hypothetical protein